MAGLAIPYEDALLRIGNPRRSLLRWLAALAAGSLRLWSSTASAQPTQAAPPSAPVVPPVLRTVPEVPYPTSPAGAKGDADVVVTLVVGADGRVREVKHVDGPAPFADTAKAAVMTWSYEPATRGGTPIAATIRVLVHFTQPRAPAKTRDAPAEELEPGLHGNPEARDTKATETKASANEPETVRVRGDRAPAPQSVTMSMAEVRQLPGAFGDPFRALEILPGVVPTISGLPFYYIRGAPPSNVGYYFDGVRVPYLFHFVFGPSVIHPMMVDRVDLYSGAFPASFGRYAGGIVSAETAAPRDKYVHANIRLIDAGALVETGLFDDKLHVLLGGRYSWIAALASAIAQNGSGDYRDYQARVTYDLSPKVRLTTFAFGGSDYVEQTERNAKTGKEEKNVLAAGEFHRIDMRIDYVDGDRTKARAGITLGLDRSRLEGNRFALDYLLQGRGHVEHRLSPEVALRTGIDITTDTFDAEFPNRYSISPSEERETKAYFQGRFDYVLSAFGDLKFKVGPRLELTTGIRTDFWGASGATAATFDPRLAGLVHVTKNVRIVFAHGVSHQRPAFPIPAPAITIPGIPGGMQSVHQTSGGMEFDLPWDVTLQANVWKNSFQNLTDFVAVKNASPFDFFANRPHGYAYGFEFMARRRLTKRVGGIVSYTLSRNVRQLEGPAEASIFDRTHVLNAAVSVDLGRNWRAGTRFLLYTGWPSVASSSATSGSLRESAVPETSGRLPTFFRFDARLEKKWTWKSGLWLSLVFEGLNVTGSTETISQTCTKSTGECRQENLGPIIIPAIGLEGGI